MKKMLLGILSGALLLTACGEKKDISKRKVLNVYTALESEQIPIYLRSFKEAYPDIELNIVRDSTGIVVSKLMVEKDNPQADVVWGTAATGLLTLDKVGLLEEYAPKGLERVNPKLRDSSDTPKWVGNNAWMSAIVVNKVELEKLGLSMPKNFKDLLKSEYRGLITMPNPSSSGTGYLSVSAILQTMGEENGWNYLEELHENIGVYVHSGSKPAKMAATGEYVIGISYGYPAVTLKKNGSPVEVVFPTEGSGWDSEANALIKKEVIKEEAKLFLDWAISDEVMREYAKQYSITGVETGVEVPEGFPKNPSDQLIENDFNWAANNKVDILKKWDSKFEGKSAK